MMTSDSDGWLLVIFVVPLLCFVMLMMLINWIVTGNPLDDGGQP